MENVITDISIFLQIKRPCKASQNVKNGCDGKKKMIPIIMSIKCQSTMGDPLKSSFLITLQIAFNLIDNSKKLAKALNLQ